MPLESTHLDYVGVHSVPLLEEFIEGHGDTTVYFSSNLRELVPGGLAVNRLVLLTDSAVYKVPQTASDTGIFFNSRTSLANLTQVLVIEDMTPCVQVNGVRSSTGEQTLFTLQFSDEKKRREALLTLCHLLPDLPILRKKKIDGKFYDVPFVEALDQDYARSPRSPPLTLNDEARRQEAIRDGPPPPPLDGKNPRYIEFLLDGPHDEALPNHIVAPARQQAQQQVPQLAFSPNTRNMENTPHVQFTDVPIDYNFEKQKTLLREQLFDHDLTNLNLRASLSLLSEEEQVSDFKEGYQTQAGMLGRRSDDETISISASRSCFSKSTRRSEEDPEAQRRRYLQLQEEERQRQEKERMRREVEEMLYDLDSKMERAVAIETVRQQRTHERIQARQRKSDARLASARDEYRRTRERQLEIENATREKHKKEREELYKALQARGHNTSTVPVATPVKPVERESESTKLQDRILLGPHAHDEYCRWRQTGGLQEGQGAWSEADSKALLKMLSRTLSKMKKTGERGDYIRRVKTIDGNIKRELQMVTNYTDRTEVQKKKDVTQPEPFKLSTAGDRRFKTLTSQDFKDELKDRDLKANETKQAMQRSHINAQQSKTEDTPLSPREAARRRGIKAQKRSVSRDFGTTR
eukprot:TRINITY_DN16159_c0_g1_i2.p1 TRINITY_DN16159_c0_g1~~TRINITY_DN16159_c0_g1_i2.p1  ORF type:complete len:638 (+),score=156.76 TRINITY_DN16159_c0_g1_i2:40-1953(+)